MRLRVIVNGAQGKMGQMACETLGNHPGFKLVAGLGRTDNLAQTIEKTQAEIVVDLTRADCAYENSLTIIQNNARPIIGTTGLTPDQIKTLQSLCSEKKLGGIIAPNFSISAILMMRFAMEAARYLPEVEIIEAHHQKKLDAPSGTAMKTAELIASARTQAKSILPLKELIPNARGASYQDINIHSIRLPGVLANQQLIFGSTGETLNITHNTIDRSAFMPGLVLACERVSNIDVLYYGLEHLLD